MINRKWSVFPPMNHCVHHILLNSSSEKVSPSTSSPFLVHQYDLGPRFG